MPRLDGTTYKFTARDVLDTKVPMLDYIYDNDAAPVAPEDQLAVRFEKLGASPSLAIELAGAVTMTPPKAAELIGPTAALFASTAMSWRAAYALMAQSCRN